MRCGVVLLGCIFCQFLASISLKSGEEAPEAEKFPSVSIFTSGFLENFSWKKISDIASLKPIY